MQLLISHLLLVLLLAWVLSAAISSFAALGRGVDSVLEGNYKSILAATKMREALEEDEKALTLLFAGRPEDGIPKLKSSAQTFKTGLIESKDSVTDREEDAIVKEIEADFLEYRITILAISKRTIPIDRVRALYLLDLTPRRQKLQEKITDLVRVNQEAMYRESDSTKALVQKAAVRSLTVTGIALAIAVGLTILLSRSLLRPLRVLTKKAEAVGAGNLEGRITWNRQDEFGALGRTFNAMSESLQEARAKEQRRLHRAERMSDQALENLYDPVIVTDAKGRIVHLNKAAEGLFGPSPTTPRTPIIEHVGDQRIVRAITRAVEQDGVSDSEDDTTLIPIKVGTTERTYRLRANPMKDDDGKTLGSVAVLEDITHLKVLDRLKTEFVSVASHELRTPVASLLISVQLLDEGALGELTPAQKEVVSVQKQDLERLERLTRELLDITRLEAGTSPPRFQWISPEDLVQGAYGATRSAADQKGVGLSVQVAQNLQPVQADRSQIERVLINLVSNAIRHTNAGGSVVIRAEESGNQVTFTVADSGAGIPKEYLDKIFDRFVQVPGATGGGAGLGLAIVHNIVKAHGGKIWVESELGAGSAFHFTLTTETLPVGETS